MGWVAFAAAVVVVGGRAAADGWHSFFRADGVSFMMVARHLDGSTLGAGDNAYRYGRVLYPLLGWVLAGGRSGWLLWTMPLLNCIAVGVAVAAAAELAARHGRGHGAGLLVLAVPALWLCLMVAWSEALLIALLLAFALAHEDGREWTATAFVAMAVLTKETAALVLVPVVLAALVQWDLRRAVIRASAILPAIAWWTWVYLRLGEWPFLASTPSRTLAVSPPFVGMVRLLGQGITPSRMVVVALVLGVAAAGVATWARAPRSPVAGAAGVLAIFSLCFGLHVLVFTGDTLRVISPALALVMVMSRRNAQDAPVRVGVAAE